MKEFTDDDTVPLSQMQPDLPKWSAVPPFQYLSPECQATAVFGQTGMEVSVVDKRRHYDDTPSGSASSPFTHVPIGDYLVVKRLSEEEGLIVEADVAKDKPTKCEIIAISPYATCDYARAALAALAPGNKILIRRFAGTDVKVDGIEYVLIMVFDVLLKLGETGPPFALSQG